MGEVHVKPIPVALGGDANKPVLIVRPAPQRNEIALWEAASGRLPEDYIAFMMTHNGGTVHPSRFHHNIADAPEFIYLDPRPGVDSLFTWDDFVKNNGYLPLDWRLENVAIGYAYDTSMIVISQRSNDFGAVRYWPRNVADWDEQADGPLPVGTIAPSFREFIFTALFDDPDGGTPRWSIPADLAKAARVRF